MRGPTSRWHRSEVTFGPVGRLLWTLACGAIAVFPIWKAITAGWIWVALYLGGIPLLFVLFPLAMRDIWRPVRDPSATPSIVLPPEPTPPAPGESIQERKAPHRW
ncbi:MAG TPA: hypothetical protein VHV76_16160 [Mycobacteriales bacterium]|nr:hypothetical protein [Mycobacteriales bacterium]